MRFLFDTIHIHEEKTDEGVSPSQSMQEKLDRTTNAIDGTDIIIAYIGGGSREWAPKFVRDMALSDLAGEVRLYDVNHEMRCVLEPAPFLNPLD